MFAKIAQKLKEMRANENGFTLVELIIVIALLGLIMALIIPNILGSWDNSRDKTDKMAIARVQGWVYQAQVLVPNDTDITASDLETLKIIKSTSEMPKKSNGSTVTISGNVAQ